MDSQPVRQSPVSFEGNARFHLALSVADIDRSMAFYSRILDQAPTKIRPGYAKYEVREPSLNLTLNQGQPVSGGTLSHLGVQLKNTQQLAAVHARLEEAGLVKSVEENHVCCYALQDKFWVADPDGNQLEFFVVLEADADSPEDPAVIAAQAAQPAGCCT